MTAKFSVTDLRVAMFVPAESSSLWNGWNAPGVAGIVLYNPNGVVSQFTPKPKVNIAATARATFDLRVSFTEINSKKHYLTVAIVVRFRTPCSTS